MCFAKFDKNGDGRLSFEELFECMGYMNSRIGVGEFTASEVELYMRRFDSNGDQHLSRVEYERLYRSLLHIKLHDYEPTPFCREMFIGRRKGRPSDHYHLLETLGEGTFGIVRKVRCRQTKTIRVMKMVDKRKAVNSGSPLSCVMEEIDKLKALDHPGVLRLFEYFVDAAAIYLVTDLLPGGDLLMAVEGAHESGNFLEEQWVSDVFRQVCEGVAYIHAKGIMHKDLKLENIMLCSSAPPEAVIIDVGLAELFPPGEADTFRSARAAGTLATMAPEVIMGSFTYKCDVWSLGCCLFALLIRRPWLLALGVAYLDVDTPETSVADRPPRLYPYPFLPPDGGRQPTREQLDDLVERQRRGADFARFEGAISNAAGDLVSSLLTFDVRERPSTREALAHPWLRRRTRNSGGICSPAAERPASSGDEDAAVVGGANGSEDCSPCADFGGGAPVLGAEQLESLLRFRRAGTLEQTVLLDVASKLPLDTLRELKPLFEAMDQDGDGMLDHRELAEGMCRAGLSRDIADSAADQLVRSSGGSKVEFSRFVAALVPSCRDLLARHLREAFDRLDTDGDGFVSREELQRVLEQGPYGCLPVGGGAGPGVVPVGAGGLALAEDSSSPASALSGRRRSSGGARQLSPAARAAREALEEFGGHRGKGRVSFESLARQLSGR